MKRINIKIPKLSRMRKKMPMPGSMPGTIVLPQDLPQPIIKKYVYNSKDFKEESVVFENLELALRPIDDSVVWLDVQGLNDEKTITKIAELLDIQALTLEDIVHLNQRPKIDEFDKYIYIVLRNIYVKNSTSISNEQISILIKKGLLVTFQEHHNGVFYQVIDRIKANKGFIRKHGIDYLLYAAIDVLIDNCFPVLDVYSETMDNLDEVLLKKLSSEISVSIHQLKRELRHFRKATWPLREVVNRLARDNFQFIGASIKSSFSDCYDHVIQVVDFIENSRERVSDLVTQHLTQVSEKTNQVMKTLTIIATIFIPLTFLCGIYGMNFDTEVSILNMPELKWKYGYLFFWCLSLFITIAMLAFFWFKGWFGDKNANN